jgi:PAS domain S-box-containing protein
MSQSDDESLTGSQASTSTPRTLGALDQASLRTTPVQQWSIQQVAAYLQSQDVPDAVVQRAVSEMVGGVELLELQNDDLRELGITKMGPRKKLLGRILKLKQRGSAALDDASLTASSKAHVDSSEDASSSNAEVVAVSAVFKKQTHKLTVSSHISLESLLLQLSNAFGCRVKIKLEDADGDQIAITSDQQLADALHDEDSVMLQCFKDLKWVGRYQSSTAAASTGSSSAAKKAAPAALAAAGAAKAALPDVVAEYADRYAMFDELLDPYIVIDAEGTILAFNSHAEKLLLYARKKVLGKNVKMLMPDTYAKKHDSYLARYQRTGMKRVIDSKRTVMAKDSSGSMIAVELGVTEKELGDTSHFVGCLRAAGSLDADDASSSGAGTASAAPPPLELAKQMRKNMASLHEAAVIITAEGRVCLFNKAAETMFGRTANEVIGGPIELLMPSPHKENHAFYLQRYVATGEQRVMNKSRDVQALHKNGQIIDVNLALSEAEAPNGEQIFIGLLSAVKTISHKVATGANVVGKSGTLLQLTRQMLNSLTIPGVIINENGVIQAFNRDAEKLLGYTLIDVVGRNVSMIMNDADAAKHDSYLTKYLSTKETHIIGKERVVAAKHKSGKSINVMLSITEGIDEAGKHIFTGMLHKTKSDLAEVKAKRKTKKKRSGDD